MVSPQNGDTRGGPLPAPPSDATEQMRLNFGKKLKTTSLNSRFTSSKKEECTLTCSLLKIFET